MSARTGRRVVGLRPWGCLGHAAKVSTSRWSTRSSASQRRRPTPRAVEAAAAVSTARAPRLDLIGGVAARPRDMRGSRPGTAVAKGSPVHAAGSGGRPRLQGQQLHRGDDQPGQGGRGPPNTSGRRPRSRTEAVAESPQRSSTSGLIRCGHSVTCGRLVVDFTRSSLGRPASASACHSARTAASLSGSNSSSMECAISGQPGDPAGVERPLCSSPRSRRRTGQPIRRAAPRVPGPAGPARPGCSSPPLRGSAAMRQSPIRRTKDLCGQALPASRRCG